MAGGPMGSVDIGKKRVGQLFEFLEALNAVRNPVVRQISEQPWVLWLSDLPAHPSVKVGYPTEDIESGDHAILLRVKRAETTPCPSPPSSLSDWLLSGWDDPYRDAACSTAKNRAAAHSGETVTERFDSDASRVQVFKAWNDQRNRWAEAEKPAREALKIFERLYELYARMEREAERVELLVGDGILNWRVLSGGIEHPILLKRLEIRFDPDGPEFRLEETEHPTDLYTALLSQLDEVEPNLLQHRRQELENSLFHPLGDADTAGFLRGMVQTLSPTKGVYLEAPENGEEDHPRLWRDPVIFLRDRKLGYAAALSRIRGDLESRDDLPESLLSVVGAHTIANGENESETSYGSAHNGLDDDILLSKPANEAQIQLIRRLNRFGAVIVQGPPGTGKTHTIGNLIGHLLAHGKSVLVTSHTTKALRVLRRQVDERLQPLCVSVLESDSQSRQELEEAVRRIGERITHDDVGLLQRSVDSLERQRGHLLAAEKSASQRALHALENEYRPILVSSHAYQPAEAARFVFQHTESASWIPGPVSPGCDLSLSPAEIAELYASNERITQSEERDLKGHLPKLAVLSTPEDFNTSVTQLKALAGIKRQPHRDLWKALHQPPSSQQLRQVLDQLGELFSPLLSEWPTWKRLAVVAGIRGGAFTQPLETLIRETEQINSLAIAAEESIIRHQPTLSGDTPEEQQFDLITQITTFLGQGGKLGWVTLATHGEWRKLLSKLCCTNGEPKSLEEFEALRKLAQLTVGRKLLARRWDALIGTKGGPAFETLGDMPEQVCRQYLPEIRRALGWHKVIWSDLEKRLAGVGLPLAPLLARIAPVSAEDGELIQLEKLVEHELAPELLAKLNERIAAEIQAKIRDLDNRLPEGEQAVTLRLRQALHNLDEQAYETTYQYLIRLAELQPIAARRAELLGRLETSAPMWATKLRGRQPPHDTAILPGQDIAQAWIWQQLHLQLQARDKEIVGNPLAELEKIKTELQRVTTELIDARAWRYQLERLGTASREKQALFGWMQTIKKIGKGTNKVKAARLHAEARKLMQDCANAVPVWIMPLVRVVENFDPVRSRFDVVIIDEASQSDLMALIALYMGRSVVVVGDHEQVSPDSVGVEQQPIDHLIATHLKGIPGAHLFDTRASVYDLGQRSFGAMIQLIEHFRCVPEIIQFSNHLSYMGAIKPLREGNASGIKPATVALKVDGTAINQVNEVEACMAASLVCAMTRHPAYDGKSLGIISLVGDDQALRIETLIRHRLDPIEFEARRIVCGNPAQFQGDERDVMILSVVDSPSGNGPLALREAGAFDMFKKRYNVAASRAKDQMWVVHSLKPGIDLKANDLRRRLIEHATDPSALMRELEAKSHAVESEFERRVMKKLVQAGYRVTSQWKVGYYRIDLVVEGGGKRIAVECDGDRYHPLEKLSEDMARQAILERLGWKFIRLRGSAFWRDPEAEMRSVFTQLATLGIPAEGHQTSPEPETNTGIRDEIIALAQELLASWGGEAETEAEPAPTFRRKRQANPATSQTRADTRPASQDTSTVFRSGEPATNADQIPDTAVPNEAVVDETEADSASDQVDDDRLEESNRDIPSLRDAILAACADGLRHDRETLIRQVSTKLGNKRLGRKVRASITRAIGAQVRAGRLQADRDQVWLASETTALVIGNGGSEIDFTAQAELNHLEQELADKELELATANAEVAHFSRRYYATVGAKYAELDELQARIAAARARRQPQDAQAQKAADEARRRADESQAEAEANAGPPPEQPQFAPSADLKKLYRQIAQKVHPDRAANDEDREWRNLLMSEANVAYQDGDESRLRAVWERWLVGMPKQVLLSLAELLRRTRERLTEIELQLNALYGSGPYELMLRVGVAEAEGRDLLDEMVRELEQQIREAREELAQLKD